MITSRDIDQAFSDLNDKCGGVKQDYFGLLYLETEHAVPRYKAENQVAFGGNDYGVDGFHFDLDRRNLYIFQFKYSTDYKSFTPSLRRLIDAGAERVFAAPNVDDHKNPLLLQLRATLRENRNIIDQVCFRFVFTGDPDAAQNSVTLERLREDLEGKKYYLDRFFGEREVGMVVDFRSSSGRVGTFQAPAQVTTFEVEFGHVIETSTSGGEQMYVGFLRLDDLHRMHEELGPRFFDRNIRYGLGEGEAVNRSLALALKNTVLELRDDPTAFAFNHNGVTLFAEHMENIDGKWSLKAPRLLNGAQTVSTLAQFLSKNIDNQKLARGRSSFNEMRVLCRVVTKADDEFVTRVTVNNNRQNPVEPWNLRANDLVQLQLQDKLKDDLRIYYERQENAFAQLSPEDLEEYGIAEDSKPIHMLRLTQTFLVTDGTIAKLSEIRRVFEEDRIYKEVFRDQRLNIDSRRILICYKVQFRLRKLTAAIQSQGQLKYAFAPRARNLVWALTCQGLLNLDHLEWCLEEYGKAMTMPVGYTELLTGIATSRVRHLLSDLIGAEEYSDKVRVEQFGFLRTDTAFEKCMVHAHRRYGWVHKRLAK